MLRVFRSKQFHFSANTVSVNLIEYGDVSGLVLSHSNLQPIAFVEKATLPEVLPHLCCELAMYACMRFWRTFPLVPGDCLDLKQSNRMTNPDSLAFVICCGDALAGLYSRLVHLQIHYHQSILIAPFHCLDPPHSHTTLTADNRNLI